MDPQWLMDKFGTVGLMLAAMLYDRARLLKQIDSLQTRNDALTDRLIEQSEKHLEDAARREAQTVASLQSISSNLNAIRGG